MLKRALHCLCTDNGSTVACMANSWVWSTNAGSWWSPNPVWSADSRWNKSKDEPDYEPARKELTPPARKELTPEDLQAIKDLRFSREIERYHLEQAILAAERTEQRQREYEQMCESRGWTIGKQQTEWPQSVKDRSAILSQHQQPATDRAGTKKTQETSLVA